MDIDAATLSQLFPYVPDIAAGTGLVVAVIGAVIASSMHRKHMREDAPMAATFSTMAPKDDALRDKLPAVDMALLLFPKEYTRAPNHSRLTELSIADA